MSWNSDDQNWIGLLSIFIFSLWGGLVSHFRRLRRGEVDLVNRYRELLIDLSTSAFSGLVIGLVLMSFNVHPLLCVSVSGIGGHAGARLIFKLERLLFNRVDSFSDKQ